MRRTCPSVKPRESHGVKERQADGGRGRGGAVLGELPFPEEILPSPYLSNISAPFRCFRDKLAYITCLRKICGRNKKSEMHY